MKIQQTIVTAGFAALACASVARAEDGPKQERQSAAQRSGGATSVEQKTVDRILAQWPAKSRAVGYVVMKKYGLPDEASSRHLIWHNNGPWKRTVLRKEPIAHYFPKPHADVLEQVIAYDVPTDKLDELAAYDGSVMVERTAGELSARCDMEAANFIALNLAMDIIEGEKDVDAAREAYGQAITAVLTEMEPPAIATRLQFQPMNAAQAADPDEVTLAGAPHPPQSDEIERVAGGRGEAMTDGAVLGTLSVINTSEVILATQVFDVTDDPQLDKFAQTLKRDHGGLLAQTMQLGKQLEVTPALGPQAQAVQENAQTGLAELMQLEGKRFDEKFLELTVSQHQQLLQLIDRKLLPAAESTEVTKVLQQARQQMASHLERARQLQGER